MQPKLLTTSEAGKYLGFARSSSVLMAVHRGQLAVYDIIRSASGGLITYRFDEAELERFTNRKKTRGKAKPKP